MKLARIPILVITLLLSFSCSQLPSSDISIDLSLSDTTAMIDNSSVISSTPVEDTTSIVTPVPPIMSDWSDTILQELQALIMETIPVPKVSSCTLSPILDIEAIGLLCASVTDLVDSYGLQLSDDGYEKIGSSWVKQGKRNFNIVIDLSYNASAAQLHIVVAPVSTQLTAWEDPDKALMLDVLGVELPILNFSHHYQVDDETVNEIRYLTISDPYYVGPFATDVMLFESYTLDESIGEIESGTFERVYTKRFGATLIQVSLFYAAQQLDIYACVLSISEPIDGWRQADINIMDMYIGERIPFPPLSSLYEAWLGDGQPKTFELMDFGCGDIIDDYRAILLPEFIEAPSYTDDFGDEIFRFYRVTGKMALIIEISYVDEVFILIAWRELMVVELQAWPDQLDASLAAFIGEDLAFLPITNQYNSEITSVSITIEDENVDALQFASALTTLVDADYIEISNTGPIEDDFQIVKLTKMVDGIQIIIEIWFNEQLGVSYFVTKNAWPSEIAQQMIDTIGTVLPYFDATPEVVSEVLDDVFYLMDEISDFDLIAYQAMLEADGFSAGVEDEVDSEEGYLHTKIVPAGTINVFISYDEIIFLIVWLSV